MNRNLSSELFTSNPRLPGMEFSPMDTEDGVMGGVVKGDPLQPLFRQIAVPGAGRMKLPKLLETVNQLGDDRGVPRRMGLHWTHDYDQAWDWGAGDDEDESIIIEADHPGLEHVMDWGGDDDAVLDRTVVGKEYAKFASPEVSVRPGAPLNVRAVHRWRGDDYRREVFGFRGEA